MAETKIRAITTPIFRLGDDLFKFVTAQVPRMSSGSILAVTSKIVSLAEKATVPRAETSKSELVRQNADVFLGEMDYGTTLTIKHGLLVAASGIDESNSENGDYLVYPADPYRSVRDLGMKLRAFYGRQDFGVIFTDSHTQPLRRGVIGIGLSHFGFKPTRDLVGTPDLFGRPLKMTSVNVLDALAASAVLAMGEANEARPLAIIEGAAVEFSDSSGASDIQIAVDEDLYRPLLQPD